MSSIADQPAFPSVSDSEAGRDEYGNGFTRFYGMGGMTLRQHYAGLMMQSIPPDYFTEMSDAAKMAVSRADALIAELEKTA